MSIISKKDLIAYIDAKYGDDDCFEFVREMCRPEQDLTALGCEYGSAVHMVRQPKYNREQEEWLIRATRFVKNPLR